MIAELDSRLRAAQCCIVVPTYNNAPFLPNFLKELAAVTHRVVIVNDGSTDNTAEILNQFQNDFHIVHLPKNRGKGMALRTAFKKAFEMGYQYAITIDSDGQHLISDLFMFLDKIEAEPGSMIVGARNMEQEGVPGKSSFGNRFSNFWYYVETFKKLPDTQSGYRLYPLEPISKMRFTTVKYEFEIEVLVRLAWKGVPVTHVPVSVIYHQDGSRISHFRPFKDFSRISVLNTVLVLIAFLYVHPVRFIRSLTWQNIKAFFNKHLFDTQESNAQLAKEMGFGFFMGIFPIWGYQMLAAVFLSHLMKLNKVVVLLAANISIPPIIPFIIYGSYHFGGLLITSDVPLDFSKELTFAAVSEHILQYLVGAVMLSFTVGIVGGLLSWVLLSIFRKNPVKQ
jgi:glycosyltransferase involved in cell wall biosynthesis